MHIVKNSANVVNSRQETSLLRRCRLLVYSYSYLLVISHQNWQI